MVGIVIVSHSARLAEGVVELAREMAPEVPLAAAGGQDQPGQPIGTDVGLITTAIEAVDSPDGVLVLMDLGSAILSTEFAVEALSPERRARVTLCEAPLIEGAIAAAVQARLGGTLPQVAAEARNGLAAKAAHLGQPQSAEPPPIPAALPDDAGAQHLELTVHNRLGLHARPAARLVQTVGRFQAEVRVDNLTTGHGPASARSLNALAVLGVRQGHRIRLTAHGPAAAEALAALRELAAANFGDAPDAPVSAPSDSAPRVAVAGTLAGIAASPGIALGGARRFVSADLPIPDTAGAGLEAEWPRLQAAFAVLRARWLNLRTAVVGRADHAAAEIFDAHLLMLEDEVLLVRTRAELAAGQNAARAWWLATQAVAAAYAALEDEYQRARAADVEDVGRQVVAELTGRALTPTLIGPGILIARDLTPADTAGLDPALVRGIATALGGPTSHSAILARSLGLPAVVGLGAAVLEVAEGAPLIVDGEAGVLVLAPTPAQQAEYAARQAAAQAAAQQARAESAAPAVTRDGRRIEVAANVGSVADAHAARAAGAEGVGLFRTEFLFLDRATAPSEDEQYAAYRAVAEALGPERPIILRTLDVGGDKPLAYVDMGREENPFLGWRAVRMCLDNPEFFKQQLRAVVRVAADFPTKVMFPMIATLAEFRAAAALLAEARTEVQARGLPTPDRLETGIMVEIPAAALRARQFAEAVDFFSIGTNDLTQYTLAAERGNSRVAALADAFQPAVLELIRQTAEAAQAAGKWAGVCGEMGGDPRAVPVLVGLGVTELSMAAPAIPRAKQIIRGLEFAAARQRAQAALALETPAAIRALLAA